MYSHMTHLHSHIYPHTCTCTFSLSLASNPPQGKSVHELHDRPVTLMVPLHPWESGPGNALSLSASQTASPTDRQTLPHSLHTSQILTGGPGSPGWPASPFGPVGPWGESDKPGADVTCWTHSLQKARQGGKAGLCFRGQHPPRRGPSRPGVLA